MPQSEDKFLEENKKVKDPYILPDGSILEMTNEKSRAPEILFSPDKIGLEYMCIVFIIKYYLIYYFLFKLFQNF